jgi:cyclic AMP-responsive element-binding protein 3
MDLYGDDRKLSELGDGDFQDFLDDGVFSPVTSSSCSSGMDAYGLESDWLDSFFEDPVLNDRMISDALQPPHIQSEHSYSLTNAEQDDQTTKSEPMEKDLETELINPMDISLVQENKVLKQDVASSPEISPMTVSNPPSSTPSAAGHTLLKNPAIILATTTSAAHSTLQTQTLNQERLVLPKVNIKLEPPDSSPEHSTSYDSLGLPPTPPSSSNSDSEGSQSPGRSAPSSPVRHPHPLRQQPVRTLAQQALFTNPIPQSGVLVLTEEEKRTLISEGYPVPNKLPLTKQEEKNLKKIRRKIKNKISAQESRRKKKEYLETLEKRVEVYNLENSDLKKKVEQLETNNRSLLTQLQKLQQLASKLTRGASTATSTQTGTCLMVLMLCFAIFLGSWSPASLNFGSGSSVSSSSLNKIPIGPVVADPYSTPNMRSRVLMSVKEEDEPHNPSSPFSYCNMFSWLFGDMESEGIIGEVPLMDTAVSKMTGMDVATDVEGHNDTDQVRQMQASMHPDVMANVLAVNQRQINTTA